MCHLLLLLPVLALPLFWLLPLSEAGPPYAVLFVVSVFVYLYVWKAWRTPPANGTQNLIGTTGRVVRVGPHNVTLQLGGELWTANVQGAPLSVGERASVVAINGLRLTARSVIHDATREENP